MNAEFAKITNSWYFNEAMILLSGLPVIIYALGFPVHRGLVSAICDKYSAPTVFTGTISDLQNIWSGQSMVFGNVKEKAASQVVSLRHGNAFPLVNKAILEAAHLIGKPAPVATDLSLNRSVSVNVTFIVPDKSARCPRFPPILISGVIGSLEIAALICVGVYQGLWGIYMGTALSGCLAVSTLCYVILQVFESIVYANNEAFEKDRRLTCKNGAASDIHVVVNDFNAHEMDVLVGYSSHLHALTNRPARVSRPHLLQWICRVLGVVLVLQSIFLARLFAANTPALYASPIWVLSYICMTAIRALQAYIIKSVALDKEPVQLLRAPQVTLPGRIPALAFINSLPMTPSKVNRWDWTDGFMPNNERRRAWQTEIDTAELSKKQEPVLNLSDRSKETVSAVRRVRFDEDLVRCIETYQAAAGLD